MLYEVITIGAVYDLAIHLEHEPQHTVRRRVLGLAISASLNAPIEPQRFGVFRM